MPEQIIRDSSPAPRDQNDTMHNPLPFLFVIRPWIFVIRHCDIRHSDLMNSFFPWLILLAPLASAVLSRYLLSDGRLSSSISIAAVLVSFMCSCLIFSNQPLLQLRSLDRYQSGVSRYRLA